MIENNSEKLLFLLYFCLRVSKLQNAVKKDVGIGLAIMICFIEDLFKDVTTKILTGV